jgi:glycosyltransferase involved in cell wall biosynthesis
MTVHQFLPNLSVRDAIGNHVLALRDVLRRRYPDTHIWADHFPIAEMAAEVTHYPWFAEKARPGDVILYHASIDSPMSGWLLARPEPLVVIYHNVTPAHFLHPFDPVLARRLDIARHQIAALAPRTSLAYGVSQYNAAELAGWGFRSPQVMPIHIDLTRYRQPVDTRLAGELRRLKGDGPAIVFGGRLAPNKAQHDLLRAYRVVVERYPTAQLWCPGLQWSSTYTDALRKYRSALGLPGGIFVGQISDSQWLAYFNAADVYLSLSEHEGFGQPAVEAMACGVPVVAYASAAIPEVVEGAGLLLDTKDPFVVAAAVERVFEDGDLRRRMIEAGYRRLERFDFDAAEHRFLDAVSTL